MGDGRVQMEVISSGERNCVYPRGNDGSIKGFGGLSSLRQFYYIDIGGGNSYKLWSGTSRVRSWAKKQCLHLCGYESRMVKKTLISSLYFYVNIWPRNGEITI